ncbi:MAG: TolC family protein [Nitrospiraceae bacterium]|nr:TolC family protein [Nitrospiraceae bacterium]
MHMWKRTAAVTTAIAFALLLLLEPAAPASALTLPEGLKIVTEKGREVSIARSDEESAREAVSLARSPWRPVVDLYARETWLQYQPMAKFGPNVVPTSQDQFTTYGVRATQVLYDFGKTSSSIAAAKEGVRSRESGTFRARNHSAFEFITAYFDLLEAEDLLTVAQEEVGRYETHRKDAEARLKAGVITKNEVLQADVVLADSKQRLLTAENARSLRTSRVNSLLLRPLNDPVQATPPAGHPPLPATLEEAWQAAERENPDLRDLDARVRAKEAGVSSVRSEYLPTLYVSGGYEKSENEYLVHDSNWSFIAGININLMAGGATDARIGMAKSELSSLQLTRDRVLDAVRLDTKAAWLEIQLSQQKIQVAEAAVAQADENLRLARLRFKEGVGTATDVTDAVTLLTTARTNVSRATYGQKRAEAALLAALGRDLTAEYGSNKENAPVAAPSSSPTSSSSPTPGAK